MGVKVFNSVFIQSIINQVSGVIYDLYTFLMKILIYLNIWIFHFFLKESVLIYLGSIFYLNILPMCFC